MKPQRLTIKQRKFTQEYIKNGGNGAQAALAAYDTNPNEATVIAAQNMDKPIIREEIERAFNKAGLNLDAAAAMIIEVAERGLDDGVQANKAAGRDTLKALDMYMKLKGAYPINKSITGKVDLTSVYKSMKFQDLQELLRKEHELTQSLMADLS